MVEGYQNGESFDWGENQEDQVDARTVEKVSRKRATASAAQQEKRERFRLADGQNQSALELGCNTNQAHGTVRCGWRHGSYYQRGAAIAGEKALMLRLMRFVLARPAHPSTAKPPIKF